MRREPRDKRKFDSARYSRRLREIFYARGIPERFGEAIAYDLGDVMWATKSICSELSTLVEGTKTRDSRLRSAVETIYGQLITHLPYHIARLRRSLPRLMDLLEDKAGERVRA